MARKRIVNNPLTGQRYRGILYCQTSKDLPDAILQTDVLIESFVRNFISLLIDMIFK